ncbi:MAG: LLM class flavin-dependent oxidoreductase [Aquihabitans sp.]
MFSLRFDMRLAPGGDARAAYQAAIEMAAWAEPVLDPFIVVSEHHASEDGYLPSPATFVSALAAATESTSFLVAAAVLPLYDPVRLAEEIAVVDHLSNGRVGWVLGLGYRPEEYALMGVDWDRRGQIADEKLAMLLDALAGHDLSSHGRPGSVHPTPGEGLQLYWGGGSPVAARRAARFDLGLFAQADRPGLADAYNAACAAEGREPGICFLPPAGQPFACFVADDLDQAWQDLGPALMRDVAEYAAWNGGTVEQAANLSRSSTLDGLRAEAGAHRILTVAEAVDLLDEHALTLHPLCGGLDPEVAWRYLRLVGEQVAPALAERRKARPV